MKKSNVNILHIANVRFATNGTVFLNLKNGLIITMFKVGV